LELGMRTPGTKPENAQPSITFPPKTNKSTGGTPRMRLDCQI
jgi:hypothetical protein